MGIYIFVERGCVNSIVLTVVCQLSYAIILSASMRVDGRSRRHMSGGKTRCKLVDGAGYCWYQVNVVYDEGM